MPFERISIDPKICHGQACVKGTRIAVHQIVRMLANGDSVEDLLAEYPPSAAKTSWLASTMRPSLRKSRSPRSKPPATDG
jgi:transposase